MKVEEGLSNDTHDESEDCESNIGSDINSIPNTMDINNVTCSIQYY